MEQIELEARLMQKFTILGINITHRTETGDISSKSGLVMPLSEEGVKVMIQAANKLGWEYHHNDYIYFQGTAKGTTGKTTTTEAYTMEVTKQYSPHEYGVIHACGLAFLEIPI